MGRTLVLLLFYKTQKNAKIIFCASPSSVSVRYAYAMLERFQDPGMETPYSFSKNTIFIKFIHLRVAFHARRAEIIARRVFYKNRYEFGASEGTRDEPN